MRRTLPGTVCRLRDNEPGTSTMHGMPDRELEKDELFVALSSGFAAGTTLGGHSLNTVYALSSRSSAWIALFGAERPELYETDVCVVR